MEEHQIATQLRDYIAAKALKGKDVGLDAESPLLEWGVINSLEMMRLLNFIETQFAVDIPFEKMTPDHFTNIRTITALIVSQAKTGSEEAPSTHSGAGE